MPTSRRLDAMVDTVKADLSTKQCPRCNGENIWTDPADRMENCSECGGTGLIPRGDPPMADPDRPKPPRYLTRVPHRGIYERESLADALELRGETGCVYEPLAMSTCERIAAEEAAPASLRKLLERAVGAMEAAGVCLPLRTEIYAALAAPAVSAWTTEPPKVAGWYWWRDYSKKIERAVSVAAWRGGGLAVHCPEFSDHHDGYTTPERCGGEWQGPIEPK